MILNIIDVIINIIEVLSGWRDKDIHLYSSLQFAILSSYIEHNKYNHKYFNYKGEKDLRWEKIKILLDCLSNPLYKSTNYFVWIGIFTFL